MLTFRQDTGHEIHSRRASFKTGMRPSELLPHASYVKVAPFGRIGPGVSLSPGKTPHSLTLALPSEPVGMPGPIPFNHVRVGVK